MLSFNCTQAAGNFFSRVHKGKKLPRFKKRRHKSARAMTCTPTLISGWSMPRRCNVNMCCWRYI